MRDTIQEQLDMLATRSDVLAWLMERVLLEALVLPERLDAVDQQLREHGEILDYLVDEANVEAAGEYIATSLPPSSEEPEQASTLRLVQP